MKYKTRFVALFSFVSTLSAIVLFAPSPFPQVHEAPPLLRVPLVPTPRNPDFQELQRVRGVGGRAVLRAARQSLSSARLKEDVRHNETEPVYFTHDDWPPFSRKMFKTPLPKSPYDPPYSIHWDFDTSTFLKRPDVKGRPPKVITWMAPVGYLPSIPEPVRLRTCPEMPCRLTTSRKFRAESAALIWNAPMMKESKPPERTSPDQVFVFHNQERQDPTFLNRSTFRQPAWRSAFNWTMSFRFDADMLDVYGYVSKRPAPQIKNYTAILAQKNKLAGWIVSHCKTHSRREDYVKTLQKHLPVDVYGGCGPFKCDRKKDSECFENISRKYKFYLAFENALCQDYVTEKMFRYLEADLVLVVRGGAAYENHVPPGSVINTRDFKTIKDLANYLHYLDENPEEYVKILRAKEQYLPMYEEYPHRDNQGRISFMHYHYEAVAFCELCRRLWNLDSYRKTIPDIMEWYDRGNCVEPKDIH